uniref:Putative group i salivary lipocalin n=1 Tax=Rhipicephalus pulchellus TaxID=72859 RepID=L7LQX2_RHIPC
MFGVFSSAAALLTLLIISTNSEDFQEKSSKTRIPSIRKFLNTSEPIWTYNSTLPESLPCTVDLKIKLNTVSIFFNRSYYVHPKVLSEVLLGKFKLGRKDKMLVAKVGKMAVMTERILYVNKTGGCAVFRARLRLPGEEPWYDLRVKNFSILSGPSGDCLDYFFNVFAKQTNRTVQSRFRRPPSAAKPIYDPWCQRILQAPSVAVLPSDKAE